MELRRIQIHGALNRPNLLMGCEREWLLGTVIISGAAIITLQSILASVVSLLVLSVVFHFLKMMGKADPISTKVYRKHISQQKYYRAFSSPYSD